jgi:hypothetical protein
VRGSNALLVRRRAWARLREFFVKIDCTLLMNLLFEKKIAFSEKKIAFLKEDCFFRKEDCFFERRLLFQKRRLLFEKKIAFLKKKIPRQTSPRLSGRVILN